MDGRVECPSREVSSLLSPAVSRPSLASPLNLLSSSPLELHPYLSYTKLDHFIPLTGLVPLASCRARAKNFNQAFALLFLRVAVPS